MRKILIILVILLPIKSICQELVRKDSIPIFKIDADYNNSKKEIPKNKGYFCNFNIQENGIMNFTFFNQYFVYFEPEIKKGLTKGVNTIPGFKVFENNENGFTTKKNIYYDLNSGLKNPVKYTSSNILSLTSGISAKGPFSSNAIEKNLDDVLKDDADDLGYKGDNSKSGYLAYDKANNLIFEQRINYYNSFSNLYFIKERLQPVVYNFKSESNSTFYNSKSISFFQSNKINKIPSLITLDSTNKQLNVVELPETSEMLFVNKKTVVYYNQNNVYSSNDNSSNKGSDWLFVPAPKSKNDDYLLVRLDDNGKLVFKHKFKANYEGFAYAQNEIVSNQDVCFIKLTLGKGLLKYQTFYVKISLDGVNYSSLVDKENLKKAEVINPLNENSKPGITINFAKKTLESSNFLNAEKRFVNDIIYTFVLSLPNDELLLGGHEYISTKQTNHYCFQHLSNDGKIKKYYSSAAYLPNGQIENLPYLNPIITKSGKIIILSIESRNSVNAFREYGIIDTEFESGFPKSSKDFLISEESKNLFINTGNRAELGKVTKNESGGILGKLDKLTSGTQVLTGSSIFETGIVKNKTSQDFENGMFGCTINVIDLKESTCKKLDFQSEGSRISNLPFFTFNKPLDQLNIICRTLPQVLKSGKNTGEFPKYIFLKNVVLKF